MLWHNEVVSVASVLVGTGGFGAVRAVKGDVRFALVRIGNLPVPSRPRSGRSSTPRLSLPALVDAY